MPFGEIPTLQRRGEHAEQAPGRPERNDVAEQDVAFRVRREELVQARGASGIAEPYANLRKIRDAAEPDAVPRNAGEVIRSRASNAACASSFRPNSQKTTARPGRHVAPSGAASRNCSSTGASSRNRPCSRRSVNICTLKTRTLGLLNRSPKDLPAASAARLLQSGLREERASRAIRFLPLVATVVASSPRHRDETSQSLARRPRRRPPSGHRRAIRSHSRPPIPGDRAAWRVQWPRGRRVVQVRRACATSVPAQSRRAREKRGGSSRRRAMATAS